MIGKTKRQVWLLILVPVVLSLITVSSLSWVQMEISRTSQMNQKAWEVERNVSGLYRVISDYLLYPEERPSAQFQLVYGQLAKNLSLIRVNSPQEQELVRRMRLEQEEIGTLFSLLTGDAEETRAGRNPETSELKERVIGQLLVNAEEIVGDSSRLVRLNREKRDSTVRWVITSVMTLILVCGAAIVILVSFIGKKIIQTQGDLEKEIGERRRVENELQAIAERYRLLFESNPNPMFVFDEETLRFLAVNEAAVRHYGWSREELLGLSILDVRLPEDRELARDVIRRYRGVQETRIGVFRHCRKNGTVMDMEVTASSISFAGRSGRLCSMNDVTERQRAEEALRQSREDLDRAQEVGQIGWWRLDTRRNALTWSDENYRIFGLPQGTPLTYETFLEIVHPDDRRAVDTQWTASLRGEPYDIEHRLMAEGRIKWVREKAYLEFDDDGELLGGFGITQDITERKRMEQELRAGEERLRTSLGEKEALLKEIHHRVKNNLQVISSLVALQADGLRDGALRAAFQDVTHRVRAMAMVHEKLYQSVDLARVEFAEYVRSLLSYLWRAHGNAAAGVSLALDLEPVSLPVHLAVPCGLILNELVINALKHAFEGRAGGEVSVSLRNERPGPVVLRVRDNGAGLPAEFDWSRASSLGLRLVQLLAGQLHAAVKVSGSGGTAFEISFAAQEQEKMR
jgi:PAS domain S-box-containing protein